MEAPRRRAVTLSLAILGAGLVGAGGVIGGGSGVVSSGSVGPGGNGGGRGVSGAEGSVSAEAAAPIPGGAFVHLFEWSWADVALECEAFLGPKGFAAVQVSPPNEHISGPAWWTRYQPVTYRLISRSGDERAFVDMVQRCKRAGLDIYADAVTNHIAAGSGVGVGGSPFGGRSTPIYSPEDMHHLGGDASQNCAVNNFKDKSNVQTCDLVGLPDLCTGCDKVRGQLAAYLANLSHIGVAGVRIDAAKHQDPSELGRVLADARRLTGKERTTTKESDTGPLLSSSLAASGDDGVWSGGAGDSSGGSDRDAGPGLFVFQEVISGYGEAVTPEMYLSLGHVTEFNYARQLAPNFAAPGKLQYLSTFGESWGFIPGSAAVVFLDNHDTQRGEAQLTYKSGKVYELANIFMLAHPYGYPKVMSSYFFDDHDQGPPSSPVHSPDSPGSVQCGEGFPWVCEHRRAPIANMAAWRRAAGGAAVQDFQVLGADAIAFCRGAAACVGLNRQESGPWGGRVKFSVPPGEYCDVIQSDDPATCPKIIVADDGATSLEIPAMGAVAVHTGKRPSYLSSVHGVVDTSDGEEKREQASVVILQ